MKVKLRKQKPFRMTVFVTAAQIQADGKPNWPSIVHVEQLDQNLYKLILESTDWRWLVRVVDHMANTAAGIDKAHPPTLEYLGPYSSLKCSKALP